MRALYVVLFLSTLGLWALAVLAARRPTLSNALIALGALTLVSAAVILLSALRE